MTTDRIESPAKHADDEAGVVIVGAQIFTRSALPWALLATPFSFETDFEVEDIPNVEQTFEAVIPASWK